MKSKKKGDCGDTKQFYTVKKCDTSTESMSVPIYDYTQAVGTVIKLNADKRLICEQLCTVSHTFSLHKKQELE
jgi:hypothetical protein